MWIMANGEDWRGRERRGVLVEALLAFHEPGPAAAEPRIECALGGPATGNEILISGLLKALTESVGEFRFDTGREVELRGMSGAQRVHAVGWR